MRSSPALALWLLVMAFGCAHAPAEEPSLVGYVGHPMTGYTRFDRNSITGWGVTIARDPDNNWRGRLGPHLIDLQFKNGAIEERNREASVRFEPGYVLVESRGDSMVFRRADGGPAPQELVVPLWVLFRNAFELTTNVSDPSIPAGTCVSVSGIGDIEVLWLPGGPERYDVEALPRCRFRFLERVRPVAQGPPQEAEASPAADTVSP
jgi:hypothetical protein